MAGCDGLCVPGVPGALGNDAPCLEDVDCASLHCSDPGDGTRRCLTPCQGDAGQCLAGEVCAAVPGACGGCVASGLVIAARGLGEPCAASTDCGSGLCYTELGGPYCSRSCAADEECGGGFHCRAVPGEAPLCIRGRREGIGTPCLVNEDCHEGGFCATLGDVSWCTDFGPPVECPTGYSCTPVGEVGLCAPDLGVPGASCTAGEQCLSGVCLAPGVEEAPICTRFCGSDAPCNPGFECRRPTDGTEPFCVPTSPLDEGGGGGGCSVAGAPGAAPSALLVLGSLLLGCCIRRRW
jgi:hypothetical protein